MMILLHILTAIMSIIWTTVLFIRPSKAKFYAGYGLTALTLASGTYLVISTPSNLVSACLAGLLYLAYVSFMLIAAHYRPTIRHN